MERTVKWRTISPDLGATGVGRIPSIAGTAEADARAGACAIDRQIRGIIYRKDHSLRGPINSKNMEALHKKQTADPAYPKLA